MLRSRKHSCSSAQVGLPLALCRPWMPYSYKMPSAVATTTLTALPSASLAAERCRLAGCIAQIAGTPCTHAHMPLFPYRASEAGAPSAHPFALRTTAAARPQNMAHRAVSPTEAHAAMPCSAILLQRLAATRRRC